MKNYWDRLPMTRVAYYQCSGKEQDLRHCKLYLISSTIRNGSMERYAYRRFVRISARVKYEISLGMMRMKDFGQAIVKSMPLLSKRVTIQRHKDKLNFSNFYILKN